MAQELPWWKDVVVYQVWPASFKDSNGDGIGDLNGLTSKLDHIQNLGVDVVWLSPHYDSPLDDMGYDISDYQKINKMFGTMEDMDVLIFEIKKRGMKLILDLVINHTSSEHAWFKESRSSRDNPKRDWYIWKDKPNNWASVFSGSAWEYDEKTEQYYLRLFAKTQPDLNWENDDARAEIYDNVVEFWLKKGVNGFRIDTAALYSKDQRFDDAPVVYPEEKYQPPWGQTLNGPRIHEFHKELYQRVMSKYDAMTVGEVIGCPKEDAVPFVSAKEKEMNIMFQFQTVELGLEPNDRFRYRGFTLKDFKDSVQEQADFTLDDETGLTNDCWTTVVIENHDLPRCVTRFGNTSSAEFWKRSAKLIATMEATLSGTLFIYQGQEIGMTNVPREWGIKEYLDIQSINYWNAFNEVARSDEEKKQVMDNINLVGRDNARTPVQWDDTENAGFSSVKPWMRVNDNYKEINVSSQEDDPDSILNFYKTALKVRKAHEDVLVHGGFKIVDYEHEDPFVYIKTSGDKKVQVVLNFADKAVEYEILDGEVILSNMGGSAGNTLQPYEARVTLLS